MVHLVVSFRSPAQISQGVALPFEDEPEIQHGSWSAWAIEKVMVSRADNEWPNAVAWIISRFFISPHAAAEFLDISEDSARAILGRSYKNERAVTADAIELVDDCEDLHSLRPRLSTQLRKALQEREVALGVAAKSLFPDSLHAYIEGRCLDMEDYGFRAEAYLGDDRRVASICSALLSARNLGRVLHYLDSDYGVECELRAGEATQTISGPLASPQPPVQARQSEEACVPRAHKREVHGQSASQEGWSLWDVVATPYRAVCAVAALMGDFSGEDFQEEG